MFDYKLLEDQAGQVLATRTTPPVTLDGFSGAIVKNASTC
jgi:hypothetical protein